MSICWKSLVTPCLYNSTTVQWGVLIERAHAILAEDGRTIREGALIEEGALTDGVRYIEHYSWYLGGHANFNEVNIQIKVDSS